MKTVEMKTFGPEDCKHFDEEGATCKIGKGCGTGSVYCRPMWTDTKCYSQEKPGDTELENYGHQVYAHGNTLVIRSEKDGKCWQLTCGDYMGELDKKDLIFVKRAMLSD